MPVSIRQELDDADPRPEQNAARAEKQKFAVRLSRHLATKVANHLRPAFPGILPDEDGGRQESLARTVKGFKKLDVNYSTPELGLGLGVSIKTINFRDPGTGRYTKNYSRADNELRAEAVDYHKRQPFSVLIAVVFLPSDSCDDSQPPNVTKSGRRTAPDPSSFGAAVRYFRLRANRTDYKNDAELFERVFVGLYDFSGQHRGRVRFFDVMNAPPKWGPPPDHAILTFEEMIDEIKKTYDRRNAPEFIWASDSGTVAEETVTGEPTAEPPDEEA